MITKIKTNFIKSFKKAWSGKEKLNNIFLWWGGVAYIICYFILDPLMKASQFKAVDITISMIVTIYFIFHIILIKKNSPKKPKLSKKEQAKLKEEKKRNIGKTLIRKLLLKEPLTKFRPGLMFGAIDFLIITTYIGYI